MRNKIFQAEALGNTFILFDELDFTNLCASFWEGAHRLLLQEKRDDALILLPVKEEGDHLFLEMRVLGVDGLFGEFCGNGARAVASYLYHQYPQFEKFTLVTKRGEFPLGKKEEGVYIAYLPLVQFFEEELIFDGKKFFCGNILEPHLAVEEALSDDALYLLGRALNQRKDLFPQGINVNAWVKLEQGKIFVKTYERGVQRLTRSCGTGSAFCASIHRKNEKEILVTTPGGELSITFENQRVGLMGPAKYDFQGV